MKKIKQPAPADSYPAFRRLTQAHTRLDTPNFGCGIALGCGRLEMGPTWDQDQWEDVIFAALPSEAVVELLSCDAGRLDGERQAERRSEFVPWLGLHPDARLRAAVATETQISPVLVRMLAADPAYEVRRQLSQNVEAVSVMKPDLVVKFAADDAELIENVLSTMLEALAQKMQECAEIQDERAHNIDEFNKIHHLPVDIKNLKRRLEEVIQIFAEHADPNVRREVRRTEAKLRSLCESFDKGLERPSRSSRQSESPDGSENFNDRRNGYDYALFYVNIDKESGQMVKETGTCGLPLSTYSVELAASSLPAGRATEEMVLRLADHEAETVRSEIASHADLPLQEVELLKKDKSYAVRRNLLNNESALDALSEEDIFEMLGEDPGLVEETFGWGYTSPRIAAMLKKRFADSPDPHLREIVAQLESRSLNRAA